jgi:ABC-type glycerol-3-phosphate transport system substrate-binding protein
VGGGPWIVSKHTKNQAAAVDFVKWVTTTNRAKAVAPGLPSYGPAANVWLAKLDKDPYFAAPEGAAFKAAANLVWQGWNMVSYQDQPVWSNSVVTQLVAGKPLSELLEGLGSGLANNAKASGYKVVK